jgi:hypothetical protein
MKTLTIAGLTLALLAGSALAEANAQATQPPASPPAAGQLSAPPPPGVTPPPLPPGGPQADMDDAGAPPAPPPPGGPGPRGNRPPPPPSTSAHFHLQRGDAMVDVKCAEVESMKACGDLALQMVDRLQATAKP